MDENVIRLESRNILISQKNEKQEIRLLKLFYLNTKNA